MPQPLLAALLGSLGWGASAAGLLAAGRAVCQDHGSFVRFDEWFRRYRDGRVVFYLRGGRAPTGTTVDSFAPGSPFQLALQDCMRAKNRAAADRLLELATFRFSPSPAEEVETFWPQSPERVREEALASLAGIRAQEVLDYISRDVLLDRAHASPAKRAAAAATLGLLRDSSLTLALYTAASDPSPEVRTAALTAVSEFAEARGTLLTRWLADPEPRVRLAALRAAQRTLERAAVAGGGRPDSRAAVLGAVRGKLDDADWRVRDRAIEILTVFPDKGSVEPLLDALGREVDGTASGGARKRVARRAGDALVQLTGVEIPPLDVGRWRRWWESHRERFEIGGHSTGQPRTAVDKYSYFTIAVKSDRMVFVVDVSGSMNEPAVGAPLPSNQTSARDRRGGTTRLDRVKEELLRVIQNLAESDRFQIIAFSNQVKAAFPHLVPATKEQKRAAERFVKSLTAGGGTALWNGLDAAFGFSSATREEPTRDADTIFLLTDGEPTSGVFVEPADIVRAAQRANPDGRVEIHCVFVGAPAGAGPQLLAQLAKESGGEYRRVDPD